jgi:hypothetical protein
MRSSTLFNAPNLADAAQQGLEPRVGLQRVEGCPQEEAGIRPA